MKIGIAGVGFMGTTHAASWQETGATLAGFVAETTEEAQGLAEKYGARVYPTLEHLLQVVDVIDICTPTHLHHAMVLQAAAAGKHIVCEKPLALSVNECSEMIFACQFLRISFFIIRPLQQNFPDSFAERFRSEITLNSTAMTNRNSPCLLRDDDRDSVGFLS